MCTPFVYVCRLVKEMISRKVTGLENKYEGGENLTQIIEGKKN